MRVFESIKHKIDFEKATKRNTSTIKEKRTTPVKNKRTKPKPVSKILAYVSFVLLLGRYSDGSARDVKSLQSFKHENNLYEFFALCRKL